MECFRVIEYLCSVFDKTIQGYMNIARCSIKEVKVAKIYTRTPTRTPTHRRLHTDTYTQTPTHSV